MTHQLSGWMQGGSSVSMLCGPILAGFLIQIMPMTGVLWFTAACSVIAAVLTAVLRLPKHTREVAPAGEEQSVARAAFDLSAWKEVLATPIVRLLFMDAFLSTLLVAPYMMVLLPAHFNSINRPMDFGLVSSGFAVGMLLGSVLVGVMGIAYRRRVFVGVMTGYILAFGAMAVLDNAWAVGFGMVCAGIATGLFGPLEMLLVTENTDGAVRGRAFSLFNVVMLFAQPIGLAVSTAMLRWADIYQIAIALAGIWIVCAVYLIVRGIQLIPGGRIEPKVELSAEHH